MPSLDQIASLKAEAMSHSVGSFLIKGGRRRDVWIAETAEDLRRIGELRYSLYVARDGKAYPAADHSSRCLIEEVDHKSLNVFGMTDGRCLAAIRLTKAAPALEDEYLRRLLLHSPFSSSRYSRLTVVSRLATAESQRAKSLMVSAIREAYRVALANGIDFAVAAARPSLVPFFSRMGFVASGISYCEAIAGEMCVLVLDVHDRTHLAAVRSILLDILDQFQKQQSVGAFA